MPLLREPATSNEPTGPIDAADAANGTGAPDSAETFGLPGSDPAFRASEATGKATHGRRRGARVRARLISPRPRRARRNAWDVEALRLPDPLLTAPMAIDDDQPAAEPDLLIGDVIPAPRTEPPAIELPAISAGIDNDTDTAEWKHEQPDPADQLSQLEQPDQLDPPEQLDQPDWAIDLSDGPKLIIGPAPTLPPSITPAPAPTTALPALSPPPAPIWAEPVPTTSRPAVVHPAPPENDPPQNRAHDTLDTAAGLASAPGRTQIPDPIRQVTEPRRIAEAMLATVLSLVVILVAWGTSAPDQAWLPLAALPAVGLIALLLPGGDTARVIRATALLAAAASLPVLSTSMTTVTLLIVLAVVATYPALVGPWAGRTVTLVAIGSLATPLLIEALTSRPLNLHLLTNPADGVLTGERLGLGAGILVVALIGNFTMHTRRSLTSAASMALTRERTARAISAQLGLASGIDSGTGLPNRDALLRTVTIALDGGTLRIRRSGQSQVGLVLVEIDRFADLADSLGPAVADDVAEQVAGRLRAEYQSERFLARVGRQQFAVMLTGATSDTCATVARRITELMTSALHSHGQELAITCSMGAAVSGPGMHTADDLLQATDEAVRAAQRSGRARWVMFDQAVRAGAHSRATLEIELREAVRRQSIEVVFQPVLALGKGTIDDRIVGAEALARWTRADGTVIEPMRFIPMADELGLGTVLGMQVIERALGALVVWRHEGVGVDQVWVNLAPSQLNDPEFAHEVAAQLAIRGLSSVSLVLEISASRLPESDQAMSTLSMLRSLGIAVALDDFGCRGTSLTALRRLPLSAVKLDQGLSTELGQQDAVPRSVAQLCRVLGLRFVVEGVETVQQLQAAREIGADAVQGFAIARPMSAEDVTNLLTLRLPRSFRLR